MNCLKGDPVPKSRRKNEIISGIFVLATLALLLVVVVFLGRHENVFEKHYQIAGLFNSAGGLQQGAEVQLAGINVGSVNAIEFGPQKRVKVKMRIKQSEQKRIRTDSIATIRTMGLMGDQFIEITVGSQNEPMIPNGGLIKTRERFELTDLAQIAEPAVKDLAKIIQNLLVLTDSLVARSNELDAIVDNITDLSNGLQQGKGTIGALLKSDAIYRNLTEILDATAITIKNFEEVSRNAGQASAELPALLKEARLSLNYFDKFSEKADRAATDALPIIQAAHAVMQDIEIIVSNLKPVSEEMKNAGPRLGPLLESAQTGISEARQLLRELEHSWLLGGSREPEVNENPIAIEGRDLSEPQEIK